jgi:glycosyltransferase involved in cell wall biosynthesis
MIYLIDPEKGKFGHSLVYLSSLLKIPDTIPIQLELKQLSQESNKMLLFMNRFINFKTQLSTVPKNEIAHFVYADLYYTFPFVFSFKRKVIFTFHSCPEGRMKRFLIRNFCNKANCIIVHSDYTKKQFEQVGVKNVICVDYPSFFDYSHVGKKEQIREKCNIARDKIVLTAIGGTRFDKGLDILLKSFQYIDKNIKDKIILNIAGMPSFFTEEYINRIRLENEINCRLVLKGLTDNEFMENILMSDYLVIPYRKSMTANSGPMTEAIVNEIPCIVSDYGNIGTITKEKHIGLVFEAESPTDLARVISKELTSPIMTLDFSYKKVLTITNFIEKHKNIYISQKLNNRSEYE